MPSSTASDHAHDCRLTADAVVVAASDDGRVDLEFVPPRQCAGCQGACLWRRLQQARLDRLPVATRLAPGTRVSVALPGRRLLAAAILTYGVPLASILAGAAAGAAVSGTDAGTLLGALAALAIAAALAGALRRRVERATLAGLDVTPVP